MMKVFISYSREDSDFVDQLVSRLSDCGLDVWLDRWEIKVGDSLIDKLNEGLAEATHLAIVFSSHSVASEWVRAELNAAFFRQIESASMKILPLRVDDCEIPPLFADKIYADFRDEFDSGFDQLIAAMTDSSGSGEGVAIEGVDFLVSEDEERLGIEILVSNTSRTTSWFASTGLHASAQSWGHGFTPFYHKIQYRVRMPSITDDHAGHGVPGVIFEDDAEFGRQFNGYLFFENESGSCSWTFDVEMPTRFRVPAKDKAALRFFFERPEKEVIEREDRGIAAAWSSGGITRRSFLVRLTTDDDEAVEHISDDLELLGFVTGD